MTDPIRQRTLTLEGTPFVAVPEGLKAAGRRRRENAERRRTADLDAMLDGFGAEGVGLYPCPAFERALAQIDGSGGGVRSGLMKAAIAYLRALGLADTDPAALEA